MELNEKIKLEIDDEISYKNNLRSRGEFVGFSKEDMMMNDIELIIDKTKEIGLKSAPYLEYYFNEIAKLTI